MPVDRVSASLDQRNAVDLTNPRSIRRLRQFYVVRWEEQDGAVGRCGGEPALASHDGSRASGCADWRDRIALGDLPAGARRESRDNGNDGIDRRGVAVAKAKFERRLLLREAPRRPKVPILACCLRAPTEAPSGSLPRSRLP
jgi:hypothetical protein